VAADQAPPAAADDWGFSKKKQGAVVDVCVRGGFVLALRDSGCGRLCARRYSLVLVSHLDYGADGFLGALVVLFLGLCEGRVFLFLIFWRCAKKIIGFYDKPMLIKTRVGGGGKSVPGDDRTQCGLVYALFPFPDFGKQTYFFIFCCALTYISSLCQV
jgi:hypothetical protein